MALIFIDLKRTFDKLERTEIQKNPEDMEVPITLKITIRGAYEKIREKSKQKDKV